MDPNINRRLNGIYSPLSYIGVNPVIPSNIVFYLRAPTQNDAKNFLLGTIWIWQTSVVNPSPPPPLTPARLWILTALNSGLATWTEIESPAAPDFFSLSGDVGTATGNPIAITGLTTAGSSVSFQAGGSTVTLNPTDASNNTIIGSTAGNATLTGNSNTALGQSALHALTSGSNNTAIGLNALNSVLTGSSNTIIGSGAGVSYVGAEGSNILIGKGVTGTAAESNVLRIGVATGTGSGQLAKAFISGIDGVNVGSVATVVTEASNQLGTAVLTAGTGITITPGANTITIAATNAGDIQTITGDSGGPESPSGGNFNFTGGSTGLTFAGSAATETLTGTLAISHGGTNATSFTTTDGVVYYDGTRLVTTTAGTAGQVLTSNGAGVAPTYQAAGFGTGSCILACGSGISENLSGTGNDQYWTPGSSTFQNTTSFVMSMPYGGTLSNLYANIDINASTTNVAITLYKNGVASALTTTVTATTTGVYSDLVHTVSVNAGDTIAWFVQQSTTGNISGSISMALTN